MVVAERFEDWHQGLPFATRVLIIEDQLLIASTLCDMVEAVGGYPIHAETIEDGLNACTCGDFDVALLDISLHGRCAAPVAVALLKSGKPFMLMAGNKRRLMGFDAIPTLDKPFSFDALIAGLFELCAAPATAAISSRSARAR